MPKINNIKRPWVTETEPKRNIEHDPFYDSPAWRRLRKQVLKEQPLCDECQAMDIIEAATVVDHTKPKKQYPELALERSNLRGKCARHHAIKSEQEGRDKR
jgi:5-methylcytosine-specific restriction protein A